MADRWTNPSGYRFRIWPAGTDSYDHVDLANNWDKLDNIIGFPIPAGSSTFGKTSIGGTSVDASGSSNRKQVSKVNLSEKGIVTKLTIYTQGHTSLTMKFKAVIYSNNAGVPNTLLAEGTEVTISPSSSPSPGWIDLPLVNPIKLGVGTYWIGVHTNNGLRYYYDTGTTDFYWNTTDNYSDGASTTFGSGNLVSNQEMSIYATYDYEWPYSEGVGGGIWYEIQKTKEAAVPLGVALPWFRANEEMEIPDGYVLADGSTIQAGDHEIPNIIGPFVVPDLRNKFVIGADANKAIRQAGVEITDGLINISSGAPGSLGEGGSNSTTLSIEQMAAHKHAGSISGWGPTEWTWYQDTSPPLKYSSTNNYEIVRSNAPGCTTGVGNGGIIFGQHRHKMALAEQGKGQPHENRPLYIGLVWIVKVKNIL